MTVLCILQARFSSTRLPGKVLKPILGEPMLARQIERIARAARVDALTVATSDQASDDGIAALCERLGVDCYRGSLDDVLDRFYQAARHSGPSHVMRLTGDCPLTDPAILDALVELHLTGDFDYSSNVEERTYPDGLDAEVFRYDLLVQAWQGAMSPYEREHVTPFMREAESRSRGVLKDGTGMPQRESSTYSVRHFERPGRHRGARPRVARRQSGRLFDTVFIRVCLKHLSRKYP